jgi:iron complex outermembrane recepter protein
MSTVRCIGLVFIAAMAFGELKPAACNQGGDDSNGAAGTGLKTAAPDSLSAPYRLEEVVVHGETTADLGMITEMRGQMIPERGGGDVAHLLRLDPGLSVTAGGKAETEIRLRGMPAHATLILIDGRPVNPGYYGKADLTMIASSGLAAVQVVKGPASAAYGPNVMGGVVNIITRSGFDAPGTDLSTRFGADGVRRLSLAHGQRHGAFALSAHGYEQRSEGFRLSGDFTPTTLEDGGLRDGSGYSKAGGGLKAGYEHSDRNIYTLTFDYHWSRRDIPSTIYSTESPTWRHFPLWKRYGASLNNQRRLGRTLELVTVLYADGQHDRLIDYASRDHDDDAINFDSLLKNRTIGGSVNLTGSVGMRHRFRMGATYKLDFMDKQPDTDAAWERHGLSTGSLFIEDQFSLREEIVFTGGLQASWHAPDHQESLRAALCPLLAARWTPVRDTTLKTTYSQAMRYPTLHRLFSVSSGNPDLRPERAERIEVGIARRFQSRRRGRPAVTTELTWFRTNLKDMIDRPARERQYRNVASGRLGGIEAAISADLSAHLQVEAGYIWFDRGLSTVEIMRELAPHRFSLGLAAGTPFGTRLRYHIMAQDTRSTYVPERMHAAYRLHELTIRQTLTRYLTLHLEVFNLADAHFEEELGYPAPGRTFTFGVDWRR